MASVTQVKRLLELLQILKSDEACNARALADRLGVSRRTMFRDLKSLEKLGVEAKFDETAQRYVVSVSDELRADAEITSDELRTLLALGEQTAKRDQPAPPSSTRLAERIGLIPSVCVPSRVCDDYHCIVKAITDSVCVRLTTANCRPTLFSAYQLLFSQNTWFVIGARHDSGKPEVISLLEIDHVELTQDPCHSPSDEDLEKMAAAAWEARRHASLPETATIRFAPDAATTVANTQHEEGADLEWLDDGQLLYRTPIADSKALISWVLSHGASAVAVSPPKLRDEISAELRKLSAEYSILG